MYTSGLIVAGFCSERGARFEFCDMHTPCIVVSMAIRKSNLKGFPPAEDVCELVNQMSSLVEMTDQCRMMLEKLKIDERQLGDEERKVRVFLPRVLLSFYA